MNPSYAGEVSLTEAEFGLFFEGSNLEKRFIESPSESKKTFLRKRELKELVVAV